MLEALEALELLDDDETELTLDDKLDTLLEDGLETDEVILLTDDTLETLEGDELLTLDALELEDEELETLEGELTLLTDETLEGELIELTLDALEALGTELLGAELLTGGLTQNQGRELLLELDELGAELGALLGAELGALLGALLGAELDGCELGWLDGCEVGELLELDGGNIQTHPELPAEELETELGELGKELLGAELGAELGELGAELDALLLLLGGNIQNQFPDCALELNCELELA
jgi:hypothetical protein